jgi:hypothetical protein
VRTVWIMSATEQAGATTLAVNLGVLCHAAGLRTCVADKTRAQDAFNLLSRRLRAGPVPLACRSTPPNAIIGNALHSGADCLIIDCGTCHVPGPEHEEPGVHLFLTGPGSAALEATVSLASKVLSRRKPVGVVYNRGQGPGRTGDMLPAEVHSRLDLARVPFAGSMERRLIYRETMVSALGAFEAGALGGAADIGRIWQFVRGQPNR